MPKSVAERLSPLGPRIAEICRVSGTAGASIGVLSKGKIVYRKSVGFKDVEAKVRADDDTIYSIGSLSKVLTAAAIGILVDEGEFTWDTPIIQILPEFRLVDEYLTQSVTVLDVVSNRIGISGGGLLNSFSWNREYVDKNDLLKTMAHYGVVTPFWTKMVYNSDAFALLAEIIERISKLSFGNFLSKRIFEPLGMKRTFTTSVGSPKNNFAKAYNTLDDGSFVEIPRSSSERETIASAGGGIKSTVNDLLRFFQALMQASKSERMNNPLVESKNPLRQVSNILSGHINCNQEGEYENSYGCGLARTQLPGKLDTQGTNRYGVKNMPIIGRGAPSTLVHWHLGSEPGFFSSVHFLNDTQSCVVVLTNSYSLTDSADWIGQFVLQTLIKDTRKINFVTIAQESSDALVNLSKRIDQRLKPSDSQTQPSLLLEQYCGSYCNTAGSFQLKIKLSDKNNNLIITFGGEDNDIYELRHHSGNDFEWFIPRNEQLRRGRRHRFSSEYWKIKFIEDTDGSIKELVWGVNPQVESANRFTKNAFAVPTSS